MTRGPMFSLEDSRRRAMVSAETAGPWKSDRLLSETALGKESDMPDDGSNPVAMDSSMADAPNVGEHSSEINRQPAWAKALSEAHARRAAERGDNWQHISSPVARVVAASLQRMMREWDK